MSIELVSLVCSSIGVAFGFGQQNKQLNITRKDVDRIGELNRETLRVLQDLKVEIAVASSEIQHLRNEIKHLKST